MVDSGGLENRCGRKPTGGSNPSLSAIVGAQSNNERRTAWFAKSERWCVNEE